MSQNSESPVQTIEWLEGDTECSALWCSESGAPPPKRVLTVDETVTANRALRLIDDGTALIWSGDYFLARQLLVALTKRIDERYAESAQRQAKKRAKQPAEAVQPSDAFQMHRLAQSRKAHALNMLLVPLTADYRIPLRRAPDVALACEQAFGETKAADSLISLREVLGLIGAFEWRKNGVKVAALNATIHPHYGVFAPIRSEYLSLVQEAPLPSALDANGTAFDIGTGTGVLAAILAKRGVKRIIGTEQDERAINCAQENIDRLTLGHAVQMVKADLFPPADIASQAALIVCNPPWIPARPTTPIEHAVYDHNSQMLRGFLAGAAARLASNGEAWLILSDIAEHLGLRTREQLLKWIADAKLQVIDRLDTQPTHRKAQDESDVLHAARAAEVTSLWRLKR
jgi:methylase of polypeptide subunit release factors